MQCRQHRQRTILLLLTNQGVNPNQPVRRRIPRLILPDPACSWVQDRMSYIFAGLISTSVYAARARNEDQHPFPALILTKRHYAAILRS
jgi:hypothetical protein